MIAANRRLALPGLLLALFFMDSPTTAQLTLTIGSPPVVITDGLPGDDCAPTDQVCFAGSLVFPGYTVVGPCFAVADVSGAEARMLLTDCSVVKDPPAGPTVVPISFVSDVFPLTPPITIGSELDVIFDDIAPLSNMSVTFDASTDAGAIGSVGPLIPPPPVQAGVAGPTFFASGITQLTGLVTFELDNVGDRATLPTSATIESIPEVPTLAPVGLLVLGALVMGGPLALLRLRRRPAR